MEEKQIHLRDYIKIIRKRRFTLYTFFLIIFTMVLIYSFSATPLYMASAKVLIEKNDSDPLATRYYYRAYDPEFLETQRQIITSFRVARKVVDILSLEKNYASYFSDSRKNLAFIDVLSNWISVSVSAMVEKLGVGNSSPTGNDSRIKEPRSKADIIAETIAASIEVTSVEESKVVAISFMSPNPALAQLIVNTVAKAYMEEILEMKMSSSGYAIKWMTDKAEEEKARLESSEKTLQKYMKANDIVTVEDRIAVVPQKLAEVGSQLTKAEAKRKELETIYHQLKNVSTNLSLAESMPVVASSSTIQSIREQILTADQEITELSKKYGPKHPTMIRAVDDLNGLKAKKEEEVKRVIQSIKNEYELARSNEENLHQVLAITKDEALNLSERFIQFGILKREVETNRLLYNALITKMKEQSVTEQTQTVNIWVVQQAKLPEFPAKPNKKRNLLLGIVLGLCGGMGLCFFIEYLDNTIKSPDDVEEKFGLSVLGVIEKVTQKDKNLDMAVLEEPLSTLAESYKGIRTALLLSSAESPPKAIVVTSMSPQEGKTTTALNLAMAVAQSELKVVIVDADLRRPRIHKVFKLAASKGLSTFLAGASDMDIIIPGPVPNLTIIPAGPIPPNPSELLSSDKMKRLVAELKEKYDLIIIDSPPLMSVTDSVILSRMLDGTIIVAKAGETTYEALDKGLKSFKDTNSRILGLVLNALDMKKSDYYHYGYYNYYSTEDAESA